MVIYCQPLARNFDKSVLCLVLTGGEGNLRIPEKPLEVKLLVNSFIPRWIPG